MANGILIKDNINVEEIGSTCSFRRDGNTVVVSFNGFPIVDGLPQYPFSISDIYKPHQEIFSTVLITMGSSPTHVIGYAYLTDDSISFVIPSGGSWAQPTGSVYGEMAYII